MGLPELPDWTQGVQLIGKDPSGNPVLIAVDADGQLYALLKGYDGTTYRPLKVDTDGQLYALIKGSGGEDIAVDVNGYFTAVMKGDDAGTLRSVMVDGSGRIISTIVGDDGVPVAQLAATGELVTIMRGLYAGTYKTIAVDVNGNIIGVFKGVYDTTLKTLQCDADGRLIAILTDPSDIWGEFRQMGLGGLAAALTPLFRYDRRGDILWWEGFENGIARWSTEEIATGSSVLHSAGLSSDGAFSCKLTAGSDGALDVGILKGLAFSKMGKFGLEVAFTLAAYTTKVRFDLFIYDGTNQWQGRVWYDYGNTKITYQDNAGVEQDLATGVNLYRLNQTFHILKLVVDGATHKYHRLLLANTPYDMSALSLRTTASALAPHIIVQVYHTGTSGQNPAIYVDNVIITQNEPA